ncbi:retrovirus-related pol polyprotein from transposon TNT 1-94 [Tanacetum coccineum]
METIHVKFDELTAMPSEHDCLEPELQRFNNHNSSAETMNTPSKEDLDNLFDSPPISSIIVEEHKAPPIETTSDEQTSPISLTEADEFNQEDSANFDGNSAFVPYNPLSHEEIKSSINGTRNITCAEIPPKQSKPKISKKLLQITRLIESMQDELTSIWRLQVWELVHVQKSTNPDFSKRFAYLMKNNFEMSMMGELKFFLRLQVHQSPHGIFISQSQYVIELLKKHGLDECVSMSTPMITERLDADLQGTPTDQTTYRRMIGWLMYLTASRLDIAFATFVYSPITWVYGCKDDCKSTSGGLQFLGGKLVSWSSKKQDYTMMSTAEAEYVSLVPLLSRTIRFSIQRLSIYSKTKHIDIRYHFIKEHVEKGTVEIYFVWTEYQLADLFTKALPKERFEYLVHRIVIIMAQQQHAADVHLDELCPPNKRYDLMDANKKIDLEHVQCQPESKILTNIIKNHPLRFSIAASSSVPWIYMAQFWHTLKEDGSNYRLKFMLDKKELSLTQDDFRTIFHLPQVNDNNHDTFMPPPLFSDMVPFYKNEFGFTMELRTSSSFKTTGLLQPWQTLCNIFSKCLTTPVTGWDQPPLQIMQRMYHNLKDDDIMKNIFNSRRYKEKVGMKIPYWMILEEMKHMEHYHMYAKVFGIDVPMTQSKPTESTQGTHRTPSALRSTCLTPPAPVPTVDKADEIILQDTLQVSLAKHKSREEQEARENVELVNEHLVLDRLLNRS